MFFQRINPKTELESLDRSLEILQDRYEKKAITIEVFSRECEKIRIKKEKIQKRQQKKEKHL